jgi:hypothetical protein
MKATGQPINRHLARALRDRLQLIGRDLPEKLIRERFSLEQVWRAIGWARRVFWERIEKRGVEIPCPKFLRRAFER